MSTNQSRLSVGDSIAFVALILALLGIAALLIPSAYPNASVELYRFLLWLCIVVASLSAAAIDFDFWDRHYSTRPRLAGAASAGVPLPYFFCSFESVNRKLVNFHLSPRAGRGRRASKMRAG
jgi:hypothetical protein